MLIDHYEFDKEQCWYKKACSHYNTEVCRPNCKRYLQMYYLMNQAGIPKALQYPRPLYPDNNDLEQFKRVAEIKADIVNWVEAGNNLYLFSTTCGNGKTSWSLKLLTKYFDCIWPGNGYECRGLFIRVGEFLNRVKRAIGHKDPKLSEYLDTIRTCDLVVWDDIGEFELTVFEQQTIIELIDTRLYSGKSNIYTSNVIDETLEAHVGKRLLSRILNKSEVVEFIGGDRRNFE